MSGRSDFVYTEGWDWIPAIRDRDTGIWQAVTLRATSAVRIGDPQIITKLPLPDTTEAGIEISVPLQNNTQNAVKGTVNVVIENAVVAKNIVISPGKSEVVLSPVEFPQLLFKNPRLWWPNGYGKPELYTARISFAENGKESDVKDVRFGIREMTYELSLLDSTRPSSSRRLFTNDRPRKKRTGRRHYPRRHSQHPIHRSIPDDLSSRMEGWLEMVGRFLKGRFGKICFPQTG